MASETEDKKHPVDKYHEALKRLISSGKRINSDTVALEAGRKRGAIKGNSPEILKLKACIQIARDNQQVKNNTNLSSDKLEKSNRLKDDYKSKYLTQLKINQALQDQLCNVVFELAELKLEVHEILKSKDNIIDYPKNDS